jgi:hypothetical protein
MVFYLHDYDVKSYIYGNVVIFLSDYLLCNFVHCEVSYNFLYILYNFIQFFWLLSKQMYYIHEVMSHVFT